MTEVLKSSSSDEYPDDFEYYDDFEDYESEDLN